MKSTFLIIALFILAGSVFINTKKVSDKSIEEVPDVLGSPQIENKVCSFFAVEQKAYCTYWQVVKNVENLKLIPNFSPQLSSEQIINKYSCSLIVNGGFYSTNQKPIGFFQVENDLVNAYAKNDLFNGIFSINHFEVPRISSLLPKDDLRLGLQSGPVLIENTITKHLNLTKDKNSRRVVLATTGENEIIFIVIYDPNSLFDGPKLANLPAILETWQGESNVVLADAINLDGGTASVFKTKDFQLTEAVNAGSFFCLN